MSQYPLNELKRRLQDDGIILPKRLKLAKNVVQSQHLPTAPKERVVAEWLDELVQANKLPSKELRDILGWLNAVDDLTGELKIQLIKVVSQYLNSNSLQVDDLPYITKFLENDKLSNQFKLQIDDYLFITTTLLQKLHNVTDNEQNIQTIFNNIKKYYKESKKKLEFITKFLNGENLETVFMFLDTKNHQTVIELCGNILFPIAKKQFFSSFLLNLIRKDNIDELIAEKGDNIQSVIKIMSAFFTFPKGRTEKNKKFLSDFIKTFVTCFSKESQIVFAFYIIVACSLNMQQHYFAPAMIMPPIIFEENDEKIKRKIFLNMLEVLVNNEVNINVRLTDTLGEKISKVEIKKTLISFLQTVMMGQLKLEGKVDKTTLNIIQIAIKLDPSLIEQKMDKILPNIMTAKKNNMEILEVYTQTINCLIETLFKLSRGTEFLTKMIPHLKLNLEASNVEQFELKQKLQEALNEETTNKIKAKIITGYDVIPRECVEMYGKLTSDLMFRQNKDLLILLQKDFEENCLMMLEEGFVSPSIITLAEMLSAILSSFLHHNKMADHTVPQHIAEDFWTAFQNFEEQCVNKFGECILKLNYNPPLVLAFLNLCLSVSHLKLLNIKYSNTKLTIEDDDLLPFISKSEWIQFTSKFRDEDIQLIWNQLLLTKSIAIELLSVDTDEATQNILETKSSFIKQLSDHPEILSNNYIMRNLFTNLDKNNLKQASKTLIKIYESDPNTEIFKNEAIISNRELLQHLVLKVTKNITECMENTSMLSKALNKSSFDLISFVKENDVKLFFKTESLNQDEISSNLDILKQLQIYYLEENYQLTSIFVLLILKNCCQNKKLRKSIDYILLSIYELSPKYPDLYKLFSVDFIFDFKNTTILDLLKLKIKTSNDMLIIKCVLESAVKKVKTDSEIVVNIVDILLKNHKKNKSSIEYFGDIVFQISCLILPLIAKEKKAITTSAFRSILANLQDKLNKAMLESFKNIDFSQNNSGESGNTDALEENTVAILNAMGAYSLTLLKCCETTDAEEIKNLNCLWSGLKFFVNNAIKTIESPTSKHQHVESSIQLLNVTLRYIKKLESHEVFQKKDELFQQIWNGVKAKLFIIYDSKKNNINYLEEMSITLKFLAELSSVECFTNHFVGDLTNLALLKKPSIMLKNTDIINSQLTTRKVSKYLWQNCLKANIIGPKCIAITKLIFRATKNIRFWIQQHYDPIQNVQQNGVIQNGDDDFNEENVKLSVLVKIEDCICELLRNDLDILSEVILAAKKISLDYKFLDAIFELQHLLHYILGRQKIDTKCEISWQGFIILFDGCVAMLNNLLLSREELLEDRWPCYMQSYKALVLCLCERSTKEDLSNILIEHKLAEMAHSIEKLTQSVCKRKTHVSRISAYAVADICTWLESNPPPKMVRQHLENSISLLIQASDSTYAMAFLRRALAGSAGQMTLTNMYTMYKRYHKYVGNA
ncbi:unnamed protein product [Euphydryas editha]|uniref:Nucleolar 27S pre-rRNA processing Urb2/Npa2 C-terminal domain-containing protein n=1 Tax=Euphydryas editha TaxID=104508 RepID=A0AAU9UI78_EUPED|nr:unnamed protein product [Euphydryas editha]